MAEMSPERAPARASVKGVFTNKLGPFPMWAWLVIGGGGIIAWAWWRSRQQAQTSAAADTSVPADQVPQFVNQTYTTVTPPSVNVSEPPEPVTAVGPINRGPEIRPAIPVSPKAPPPRPFPYAQPHAQPPIFNATYRVLKGETLDDVAKKFRITRVELAHANGLGTGAGLRAGQVLKVPRPAPQGTPNPAI
jgi:hypothetical protein